MKKYLTLLIPIFSCLASEAQETTAVKATPNKASLTCTVAEGVLYDLSKYCVLDTKTISFPQMTDYNAPFPGSKVQYEYSLPVGKKTMKFKAAVQLAYNTYVTPEARPAGSMTLGFVTTDGTEIRLFDGGLDQPSRSGVYQGINIPGQLPLLFVCSLQNGDAKKEATHVNCGEKNMRDFSEVIF